MVDLVGLQCRLAGGDCLIFSTAVYALLRGNRAARFFLLGWGFS